MSIESEIKAAVEQRPAQPAQDDAVLLLRRSEIHAAIVEAFQSLAPGKRWSVNEVRLLDIVDHWIDSITRKG